VDTPGEASCKEVGEEESGCFVEVPEGGIGDIIWSYRCTVFQVYDGQTCFVYCVTQERPVNVGVTLILN